MGSSGETIFNLEDQRGSDCACERNNLLNGGEFAAMTVADLPGEAVAEFLPVELDEDASAFPASLT